MIPSFIHYCWFGNTPLPHSHRKLIDKWKRILPGYTFQCWNEKNFNVNCCEYSKAAYKARKFAYVSDVARCYILVIYGGIYLDTDVELFESFDAYRTFDFFTAMEIYREFGHQSSRYIDSEFRPKHSRGFVPGFGFMASVLGSVPGNALLTDCLEYYNHLKVDQNGFKGFAIDGLLADRAVKYGFKFRDVRQILEKNMLILETGIFGYASSVQPHYKVLYHHNAGSWAELSAGKKRKMLLDQYGLLEFYLWLKKWLKR